MDKLILGVLCFVVFMSNFIRYEKSFKVLKLSNQKHFYFTIVFGGISFLFCSVFHNVSLHLNNFDMVSMMIIYFVFMFLTCLGWRRKEEKFFDPFISKDGWNVLVQISTAVFGFVISLTV